MSFRRWLELRVEQGWSDEEAARHTGCGEGCGTCKGYLAVVLATGTTCLPVMTEEELAQFAGSG